MAALSIVGDATAPLDDLSDPQAGSALSDVTEAYAELERAREAVDRAKSVLVECIADARDEGARLVDVAAAMDVTRQYVQKLMREYAAGVAEEEAYAAWSEREARKAERDALAGVGFTSRDRQCGVCHRFKSRPSDVCEFCGDDPVTHNGERRDYDAAYAGGIR